MTKTCFRGDVYYVNSVLNTDENGEKTGRPAVIVSNNRFNRYSNNVTVVYLSRQNNKGLPTHVPIVQYAVKDKDGSEEVFAQCETVSTVSKDRLNRLVAVVDKESMRGIADALKIQLGIEGETDTEFDN